MSMMRSNVLTLRTVKRNGENVLTVESDTGVSSTRLNSSSSSKNRIEQSADPSQLTPIQQIDTLQYIDEPVTLIATLHDSRTSPESIMVDLALFPGASEGDVAELEVSNKKLLFIVKKLNDDLQRRKIQLSVSNSLQTTLELSSRTNVTIRLKDKENVEADLVEIMVKDINLTRGDMWILSSSLNKKCVYKSQRVTFFESIRGNVSLMYRNGRKVFSGYVGESTKIVFRSESARLLFLIQITEEMYHFQEDGEVMFHKVVNSLFPKIFKKWREKGTHHLITIVFAANVDFSDGSWNDLKQGEKPQTFKDYFRVVVDQVNIVHWNEIMISLRYEFANFRKGIVKQQIKEGRRGHRFAPALKSDILNSIKLSTSLVVDRLKDPDLKHTTNHFIVISAGNGLYDVDYDELLDTGKRIFETELSVDIICLTQPPLYVTPLFRYRDKTNDSLHHVVPGWIDVSFWTQDTFREVQWLPRCKMYELQMMGVMENEMNAITVDYLRDSLAGHSSIVDNMNNYDKSCFESGGTKKQLNQSMIWRVSNLSAVTKTEEIIPTSPTFSSVSKSAISSLQQIGGQRKEPLSAKSSISFLRPNTGSKALDTKSDTHSIRSVSTALNTAPTRPPTSQSNQKTWLLQNQSREVNSNTVSPEKKIDSLEVLKQMMWTEIDNPSKRLDYETLKNLSVGKWQDVFPLDVKRRSIKWRSLLSPSELPVMTPLFPSVQDFETNFTFQTHMISLSADREQYMNVSDLMRDMIHVRLMLGFQICYGELVEKIEAKRHGQGDSSLIMKYFPFSSNLSGSRIYLSVYDEIHRISCEYDGTINVQRYSRTEATSLISPKFNDIGIRTRYQNNYHEYNPDPKILKPRNPNWNQYDQLLAGYDDYMDFEYVSVHRVKFVLLPTEIPKTTYLTSSSTDEQLTPEETRVEGLRRLIMTLNRGTFDPKANAKKPKTKKDEIFPEISFYTGDLIACLKDDFNKSDVNVLENSSLSKDSPLEEIEAELMGPKGLKLQDRKWHFKLHKNCFRGVDLVSWLIENLNDINTREEGVAFGNRLMVDGIIIHVENRHKFLDGHYFYRLRATGVTSFQMENSNSKSETSSEMTRNKTFILSRSLRFDLDPNRTSYKKETMRVHFDTVHNPNHCYHIRLEWLTATPKFIDDTISSWSRMCERYGLKLVETPWNELCEIPKMNPFHSYVDISLAINPWTDKLFYNEEMMKTNKFYYHIYLLEFSGFLMDNRASLFFKDDKDEFEILYSWGKPQFKYAQYIHKTGAYIAEVRDTGDLFLAPNNTHIARVNISSQDQISTTDPSSQNNGEDSAANILDSQKIMLEFRATCLDSKKLKAIFIQARNDWYSNLRNNE
ncbi:hypothetical protein WICPIJ_008813 [Wickerhamomyces pijperi]|uniref:Vacuolar membrane-associated protein IML1 n=1 Tax=Wickerhamomyces pijperi TaxID=599730 RepID=A0A9P8THD9_WICPI|nr:hypothetical protein WICPIJ_008813 [Wickerhamomyces pijperi]